MSCGNSKQQLERAGINALSICPAPYRSSDHIIGCPFSEHHDEVLQPVQGYNVLTSISNKLDALLSNSLQSRSESQAQQIEYQNIFAFEEVQDVCYDWDILPHQHHVAIVKAALSKMTSNILKDISAKVSGFNEDVGDEYAVQKHLAVFLNEILVIANRIICGDDFKATSGSFAEKRKLKVKVEREWAYRIDNLAKTPLSSTARDEANRHGGDLKGGCSDFSVVHDRCPAALTLFEAKKTQLDLNDLSKAEGNKAIAQCAYQMVGDIRRLANVSGHVTSYSSLLTNGLTWLHLKRVERLEGMVWLHSSPISVVKKGARGKKRVDEAGIDIVVRDILHALVTARNLNDKLTEFLALKKKTAISPEQVQDCDEDDNNNYKDDDGNKDNRNDRKRARKGSPASHGDKKQPQSSKQNSSSNSSARGYIWMPLTEYNLKHLVQL